MSARSLGQTHKVDPQGGPSATYVRTYELTKNLQDQGDSLTIRNAREKSDEIRNFNPRVNPRPEGDTMNSTETVASRLDAIEARANAVTHLDAPTDGLYAHARTDVPALVAAIRGVLKVHEPVWRDGVGHFCKRCSVILDDDRPDCPTVATITAALTEVSA